VMPTNMPSVAARLLAGFKGIVRSSTTLVQPVPFVQREPIILKWESSVRQVRANVAAAAAAGKPVTLPYASGSQHAKRFIPPCIPTRALKPSAGPDRVKYDGYRHRALRLT
jgi:hypothetical protein